MNQLLEQRDTKNMIHRHTVMLQLLFDLTDAGKNESFIRTTRYKENDSPQIFPSPSLQNGIPSRSDYYLI